MHSPSDIRGKGCKEIKRIMQSRGCNTGVIYFEIVKAPLSGAIAKPESHQRNLNVG